MTDPDPSPREEPELPDPLPPTPLAILARWLEAAREAHSVRNHDAMALASVDASGAPRVRMVLCRGFDLERGRFTFYTNRESPKAREVETRGRASAVFHWDSLGRQVRISGRVERAPDADSDAYFASRDPRSQIAAWASAQSQPIASRAALIERFDAMAARLGGEATTRGDGSGAPPRPPRPPNWGGYCLVADEIELWVERPGRLHDRARWTRSLDPDPESAPGRNEAASADAPWKTARLQP